MENLIKVNQRINSTSREFDIGKGAKINLTEASTPMIIFLRMEFVNNPDCLVGDIGSLMKMNLETASKTIVRKLPSKSNGYELGRLPNINNKKGN